MSRYHVLAQFVVAAIIGCLLPALVVAQDAPAANQPAAVQPAAVQPAAVQPAAVQPAATQPAISFDRQVAPLLASYCLDCHGGEMPQAGLDLSRRESAMAGGESGPAIQPGQLADSLIWQRIASDEMPPKHPLPDAAKRALRQWIQAGAQWGTNPIDPFRFTTDKRAGLDWWSLQPLADHLPPDVRASQRVRDPIDAFLLDALERRQLSFSEDASPRVLVRRLYFDLLGLPPDPEVLARFTQDPSERAYRQLVDQLLDSPHYGERWGRHWLDVARFGESDGFERNSPRETLWPFRDWVIRSLNEDLPYDQFARMQIAGDLLTSDAADGLAAAGFLVAGVHNTVVGSSEMMRLQAREDELEEIVGAVGQTFLGLTVNCSRCHNHKFDPIRQEEYYQLTAAIAGVHHGEREVAVAEVQQQLAETGRQLEVVTEQLKQLDQPVRRQVLADRGRGRAAPPSPPQAYASWEFDSDFNDQLGRLPGKPMAGARLEDGALVVDGKGYVATGPLPDALAAKTLEAWVQLDSLQQRGGAAIGLQSLDGAIFDAIVFGEREPRRWMAGSNFFQRSESFEGEQESEASRQPMHVAIVYDSDGTITGYRNGRLYGKPFKSSGLLTYPAGQTNVVFGMRHAPAGSNKMLQGKILRARLYDRPLAAEEVAVSAGTGGDDVSDAEIIARLAPDKRIERQRLVTGRQDLLRRQQEHSAGERRKVYTVSAQDPQPTHLLRRGSVTDVGPVVAPGGVAAIAGSNGDFGLSPDAPDAERRRKLAEWIAGGDNPLFARVIVNRIWHHHFGVGLVETPNDFGFNGGRPSHPELLDWLASRLVDDGYRLKPLHRRIVNSTAYRQSADWNAAANGVDAGNRLIWRRSPRRLEAEVLRDAMLQVSGKLNTQRGGPGFKDVTVTMNSGTNYYEPIDREDEQFNRRTVYRFWPRGGRSALLDTFDCPDPSTAAPRRSVTTTPLQALSLLNNAFVLRMSGHLDRRLKQEAGDDPAAQADRAFQLAYGRQPDDEERQLAVALITQHGAAALARALFNSNEFVVIE